eukprot:g5466.t2
MQSSKRSRREVGPFLQDYRGYVLSAGHGVDTVQYSDLTPNDFFNNFVGARKPVLVDGCLAKSEGWRGDRWTNQYLRDKAGDATVKVEYRGGAEERFGRGLERPMKFGDFVGELERKNDLLYLTTQELDLDPNGRPALMSAPLDSLREDFPLRPRLVGALVPQNVNLWMGHTKSGGSSSGLHHDFHDNLYVLLRGKKTFRLFSPADAHRMYLEGELVKVHPNGRINYRGKETLADGSDPLAETAARAAELVDCAAKKAEKLAAAAVAVAPVDPGTGSESGKQKDGGARNELAEESRRSEEEVAAAQAALERGESGAAERLAAAEEELERALEAVLDAECAGGGGFGDGGSGDSSSDSDGGPGFFDGINDNPSEEAFLAATTKKTLGGRAVSGGGIGGEGGGVHLGADDGEDDGDEDDDGSEMTDQAEEQICSNVGHTSVPPPPAAAAYERRKGVSRGSGLGGDHEANGGRTGTAAGAGAAKASEVRATKRKKCRAPQQGAHEKEEDKNEEDEDEDEDDKGAKSTGAPPANFSKVDPSLPRAELAKRFPLFLEAECCTVEVKAGQMLFLPAGWFHEVSSVGSEDGHMAFNYWFHPPDSFDSPSAPYKSSFWQRDWEARQREVRAGITGENGPASVAD